VWLISLFIQLATPYKKSLVRTNLATRCTARVHGLNTKPFTRAHRKDLLAIRREKHSRVGENT
jgi:hypothetical protein